MPDNSLGTVQNLGPLNCGDSRAVSGVNAGRSHAWYEVTLGVALPQCALIVDMTGSNDPSGDVFDFGNPASGFMVMRAAVKFVAENASGTYLIDVYIPSGGQDGPFAVTFTTQ